MLGIKTNYASFPFLLNVDGVPWPTYLSYNISTLCRLRQTLESKALRSSLAEFIFCICFRGIHYVSQCAIKEGVQNSSFSVKW